MVCSTRFLKNAKFLQAPEVGFFPESEPQEGFQSLLPFGVLSRLERLDPDSVKLRELTEILAVRRPPKPSAKASSPLFSGRLRFVAAVFDSGGNSFEVPQADLLTAMQYTGLAIPLVSRYCSQYGPNSLALAKEAIPFVASVTGKKYNDQTLAGWVDSIAGSQGLGTDDCLVFLNPSGVVNTDADATTGVLGYHNLSKSGRPYAFVNVMGQGLTVRDDSDTYAMALSHEIAEMTVDPLANGSNAEVSDSCSGNCSVDYRNYFDAGSRWIGGSPTSDYAFFLAGIATPAGVASCPAPQGSCTYPPPTAGMKV